MHADKFTISSRQWGDLDGSNLLLKVLNNRKPTAALKYRIQAKVVMRYTYHVSLNMILSVMRGFQSGVSTKGRKGAFNQNDILLLAGFGLILFIFICFCSHAIFFSVLPLTNINHANVRQGHFRRFDLFVNGISVQTCTLSD